MMNIMIDKRVKLIKMKENKMIPPASSIINDDRICKIMMRTKIKMFDVINNLDQN